MDLFYDVLIGFVVIVIWFGILFWFIGNPDKENDLW